MQPKMGRVWTIVRETMQPGEQDGIITMVGVVLDGPSPVLTLRQKLESPDRDVVYLTKNRMVVVRPKPAASLGLRDAFRMLRGNTGAAADTLSLPISDVKAVKHTSKLPAGLHLVSGDPISLFMLETAAPAGTVRFWVDTTIKKPQDVEEFYQYAQQLIG